MKKAPPNRTGPEIWHDMIVWNAQRRRQEHGGERRVYDITNMLKEQPEDEGRKK